MSLKTLLIASECAPMAKVGGLADVVSALPKALKKLKVDVSIILPFYEIIKIKKNKLKLIKKNVPVLFNGEKETFNLWKTFLPKSKVPLLLIENKEYFPGKGVYIERDASSGGSKKEASRFLFLSKAGIEVAKLMKADVLHCHDWHTALIPLLINKEKYKIKTLFTIHNIAYQGTYSTKIINKFLGLKISGKKVNSLKMGILNADFINTVSQNYAKEILTSKYGFGLQKYLKKRKKSLAGILNGLDLDHFSPEKDSFLTKKYSDKSLGNKIHNKTFLQKKCFGKKNPEVPVIGIISRLADQKGLDLIKKIFPSLMKEDLQFILLGTGDPQYEKFFEQSQKKYPKKCWVKIGFDEKLAHQIYGGIDIFLMPSHFEPCGLGQQIALRYGTVPVARETGGIKDTVPQVKMIKGKIKGSGFLFKKAKASEFFKALQDSLYFYERKSIWKKIQINGMKQDFSWKNSAKKYKSLYKKILK